MYMTFDNADGLVRLFKAEVSNEYQLGEAFVRGYMESFLSSLLTDPDAGPIVQEKINQRIAYIRNLTKESN